jgi:hypothetical protein
MEGNWYLVKSFLTYIQTGTSPGSCFLCQKQCGTQPRSSLHRRLSGKRFFSKKIQRNIQTRFKHSRPIIPTGSGDGCTAKQKPAIVPWKMQIRSYITGLWNKLQFQCSIGLALYVWIMQGKQQYIGLCAVTTLPKCLDVKGYKMRTLPWVRE